MKLNVCILTLVGLVACTLTTLAQTNSTASEPPAPVTPATPTDAPAADAAKSVLALQAGATIPLIIMDEVPLTDAIKNLARQAGVNYMLDPKIGFGQPGTDGKPVPQPSVSIRWENITAEQALNALLNNHSLQLAEDPKTKIARVTAKDPLALEPLVTKIYQLKFASPSNIVTTVQGTIDKRSKVMPDYRSSQLVVVATEKELVMVDELILSLDTKTKQVLIECRMLETIVNPSTTKGVDWSGTLKAQKITFGNGILSSSSSSENSGNNSSLNSGNNSRQNSSQNSSQNLITSPGTPTTTTTTWPGGATTTTTTTPDSASSSSSSSGASSGASSVANAVASSGLSSAVNSVVNSVFGGNGGLALDSARGFSPSTFFLNADGVKAVVSFLNTYAETRVISTPRTVTLDNETATIEVGTLFPIVNTTAGTANTTGGSSISYSNLTVALRVTPRISANNYVRLQVDPRVVRLGNLVPSVVGGVNNAVYSFYTREITTSVLIPSGNTLVMGGLIQDEISKGNIKVPLLGDIPYIGLLFRNDTKSRTKSNMIVFLTPTIVEEEDFQATTSNYLKTKVPVKDTIERDWSAWDSGKPIEWSKPSSPKASDSSGTQP